MKLDVETRLRSPLDNPHSPRACRDYIPSVRLGGRVQGHPFEGGPCLFLGSLIPPSVKTIVYVDAFNLYYGALKGTSFRWLNLDAFFRQLFPKNEITKIKYFTAMVNPLPGNPDQRLRQQLYIRALQTLPHVSVVKGHYLSHEKTMPLAHPHGGHKFAQVIFTEEKGSDVNLASHLLFDAFTQAFECAIVVSGDSDLATPIEMVKKALARPVGVLLPQLLSNQKTPRRSAKLQSVATFFRGGVRAGVLGSFQFPDSLTDSVGTFTKPKNW